MNTPTAVTHAKFINRFFPASALFIISMGIFAPASQADSIRYGTWSADGWQCEISSDTLATNQVYAAVRQTWFNVGIESSDPGDRSVTGLVFTCMLPSTVVPMSPDIDREMPYFMQWHPAFTAMVYKAAAPLNNNQWWSTNIEMAHSNAWLRPKIQAKRTVLTPQLPPNEEVTQVVISDVFIPPGALNGMATFSVQLNFWDIQTGGLSIDCYSNTCSSGAFTVNSDQNQPSFVCTSPGLLAGPYSFTNYVKVTSYAETTMNFAPAIQLMYSRTQSPWSWQSSTPSYNFEHNYDNGIWVGISSPVPAVWDNQTAQDNISWNICTRYAPVNNDLPGLTDCAMFRSKRTSHDGNLIHQFFVSAGGTNIVCATLTTPDNTTYDVECDSDELDFEANSLNASDFARFTNGIYTIRLYDFNNVLRQTYSVQLSGTPVTSTPQLLAPNTLWSNNVRPNLSWNAPSDPNVNGIVLDIENANIEDDIFNIWMGNPLPTSFQVENDLYGGWTYDLLFANATVAMVNGTQVMSGYIAERTGFFNVATQNLAYAYADTDASRTFTGTDLELNLFSFGFLEGSNYTFSVDFGDGTTADGLWGTHHYAGAGNYTARVIVSDDLGMAATGSVALAVYDLPTLKSVTRLNGNMVDIDFPTIDGAEYTLRYTDDLSSNPTWNGVLYSMLGDGTIKTFHDSQSVPVSKRFYRLECDLNP